MKRGRRYTYYQWVYIMLGVVLLVFGGWLVQYVLVELPANGQVHLVQLAGTWEDAEGYTASFQKSTDIPAGDGEVRIRGHVQQDIPPGQELLFYIYRLDVRILVNGQELTVPGGSEYARWESVSSPGITTADEVVLLLRGTADKSAGESIHLFLDKLYSGSVYGLALQQIRANMPKILTNLFILIIGAAILVTMGMLNFFGVFRLRGFFSCSLLLLTGAVCTLIDYEYITLLIPQPALVNFVDYLSQLLICEFLMIYLQCYLRTKRYIRWVQGLVGIWTACILFYCLSVVKEDYLPFGLLDGFSCLAMVMLCLGMGFLMDEYRLHRDRHIRQMLLSGLLLLVCTMAEVIHYFLTNTFWITVFQLGLLLFTIVQVILLLQNTREKFERAEQAKIMEGELAQSRIDIMMSQIRPHFIFNALNTISGLCLMNPQKADEAIMYFSDYLRMNISSLQERKLIDFEEELKNVRCYVAIEQIRFGDRVRFVCDIRANDFQIPMLTLEPLVENAIKHGINRRESGGTVQLASWREGNDILITITDDGVGFDSGSQSEDSRRSIGLQNVRSRLAYMTRAEMSVQSEPDKGTVVTIRIPVKHEEEVSCM